MTKLITLHFVTTTYLHFIKSVNELYCEQNTKRHHVVIEIALCHNGRAVVGLSASHLVDLGLIPLPNHTERVSRMIFMISMRVSTKGTVWRKSQQVPLG